jgi:hypothetical protein
MPCGGFEEKPSDLCGPDRWFARTDGCEPRAVSEYGHGYLQRRLDLQRDEANGCLSLARRRAILGHSGGQPLRTVSAGTDDNPDKLSGAHRNKSGLGQHREQSLPLPWDPVVWQDQARRVHVRSGGKISGDKSRIQKGLRIVGARRASELGAGALPRVPPGSLMICRSWTLESPDHSI